MDEAPPLCNNKRVLRFIPRQVLSLTLGLRSVSKRVALFRGTPSNADGVIICRSVRNASIHDFLYLVTHMYSVQSQPSGQGQCLASMWISTWCQKVFTAFRQRRAVCQLNSVENGNNLPLWNLLCTYALPEFPGLRQSK